MELQQLLIHKNNKQELLSSSDNFECKKANLVLVFGQRTLLEEVMPYLSLKSSFPNAEIVFCSSSGQISNNSKIEEHIVVTAISFKKTTVKATQIDVFNNENSIDLGKKIKEVLLAEDLKSILIFSEGSITNASELIAEVIKQTNSIIPIFGGLAGDEYSFEKTIVGLNDNPTSGKIVAIGFYGKNIHFKYSSEGGLSQLGLEREVTHSDKNVLYKVGDRNALDFYKEYLGKYADQLPTSSLYFPLCMRENIDGPSIVRTIISIDEEKKTMTFAGDIPQGSYIRLMKANSDKLIEAAFKAAQNIADSIKYNPQLAILISCAARRAVLEERVGEELEVMKDVFGDKTLLCGFYSYGEISPTVKNVACELHNQTMTIATIFED